MERNMVDMKIIKGLCTNGIPFNVLRNLQFIEIVNAMKKASDGYKSPYGEKVRTVLFDECVRDFDKDLIQVKDTWYTQGVSVVSDGLSNVKHKPLLNVLVVNACGAVFMYTQDYSGAEKTGIEISKEALATTIVLNSWRNWVKNGDENTRWEKMNIPLHCLGFALNPKFYEDSIFKQLLPVVCKENHQIKIKRLVQGVMEAFRISENEEEGRMLQEQFVTFHMKKCIYSMVETNAVTMDEIDWWSTYGAETLELAEVAKKVLSQLISSYSAERN
ncbi:hypothetical protein LXL04_003405 [Taraxacum kok-saghyz]